MDTLQCPLCHGEVKLVVCDDEGNRHPEEYESDPWSGLGFYLHHGLTENPTCPIAHYDEDHLGEFIYDSREEARNAWAAGTVAY